MTSILATGLGKVDHVHVEDLAQAEGTANKLSSDQVVQHEHVIWWKDSGLRKLYFLLTVCLITSATNGFDGSMQVF